MRVGMAFAVGVAVLMTLVAMIMRMAVVFMAVATSNVGNLPRTTLMSDSQVIGGSSDIMKGEKQLFGKTL